MKKYLILVLIMSFTLVGCNLKSTVKGEYDIHGTVTELDDEGNRILVDDQEKGLIWITLHDEGNIKTFEKGQNVAVWTDGKIRESYPMQANATHIEPLTTPDKQ